MRIPFVLLAVSQLAFAGTWPELSATEAGSKAGANDAALIIGIEKYAFVPGVTGARQNAEDWFAWLGKTRGVPAANMVLLRDQQATVDDIREAAADVAKRVKPGGTLWFVFIGHGAPAQDGKDGVLVGVDAQQEAKSLYRRSLPQSELLKALKAGKQGQTIAVIDACFSGKTSRGEPLVPGLQPVIAVREVSVPKATVVMTAGTASEFAGPLNGADRPAFSYLVLGAMRGWGDSDSNGEVTAAEAVDYARDVLRTVARDRVQTPQLVGDGKALLGKGREKGPDLLAMVVGGKAPSVNDGSVGVCGELTPDACVVKAAKYFEGPEEFEPEKAVKMFEATCAQANAEGCGWLGKALWKGIGTARNQPRAIEMYQKACAGDSKRGCNNLGAAYESGAVVAKDLAKAVELYSHACELGEGAGCANLGRLYGTGEGVAKDEPRAATLYERGCKLGTGDACDDAGAAYANGRGVVRDDARAFDLFKTGCELGSAFACNDVGWSYAEARGPAKDLRRAFAFYDKACKMKSGIACTNVGLFQQRGSIAKADLSAAAKSFEASCEYGYGWGCSNLASLLNTDEGVGKDPVRAASLFDRACTADVPPACDVLGAMYTDGNGIAKDEARGFALFEKACKLGDANGCNDVGWDYGNGRGVEKNEARAIEYYKKSCEELRNGGACTNLGISLERGRGVNKDPVAAGEAYRKSCEYGYNWGCRNYGVMLLGDYGIPKNPAEGLRLLKNACAGGVKQACTEAEASQ